MVFSWSLRVSNLISAEKFRQIRHWIYLVAHFRKVLVTSNTLNFFVTYNIFGELALHKYKTGFICKLTLTFSIFSLSAHIRAMEPILFVIVTSVALARSSLLILLRRSLEFICPKLHTPKKLQSIVHSKYKTE